MPNWKQLRTPGSVPGGPQAPGDASDFVKKTSSPAPATQTSVQVDRDAVPGTVPPSTPRTAALSRLSVALASGKTANVKAARDAAKAASVPLNDIMKAVQALRGQKTPKACEEEQTEAATSPANLARQTSSECKPDDHGEYEPVSGEACESLPRHAAEIPAATDEPCRPDEDTEREPTKSEGHCVECGVVTTSFRNYVWCCVPCIPIWESALREDLEKENHCQGRRSDGEFRVEEAATEFCSIKTRSGVQKSDKNGLNEDSQDPSNPEGYRSLEGKVDDLNSWFCIGESTWAPLSVGEGKCVECGDAMPAFVGIVRCCTPCIKAWDGLLEAGWRSSVICDGWSAAGYAKKVMEEHGLSKIDARRRVMEDFPASFAGEAENYELQEGPLEEPDMEAEPCPDTEAEPCPDEADSRAFSDTKMEDAADRNTAPQTSAAKDGRVGAEASEGQTADCAGGQPARQLSRDELSKMKVSELKALLRERGLTWQDCKDKQDFIDRLKPACDGEPAAADEGGLSGSGNSTTQEGGSAEQQPQQGGATGEASPPEPLLSRDALRALPVSKLRHLLKERGISARGLVEKRDIIERLAPEGDEADSPAGPPSAPPGSAVMPSLSDRLGLRTFSRSGTAAPAGPEAPPAPAVQQAKFPEDITVYLTTDAEGFEDWSLELKVSANVRIGGLRRLLARSPYDLPVTERTRFRTPGSSVRIRETEKVFGEMVLTSFIPDHIYVQVRSDRPGVKWRLSLQVPLTATVADLKSLLKAPPHNLPLEDHEVWMRPMYLYSFNPASDGDPVDAEVILIGFWPDDTLEQPQEEPPLQAPLLQPQGPPPQAPGEGPADGVLRQRDLGAARAELEQLARSHGQLEPRARRAHSWGRSLAYAQVVLSEQGRELRRGNPKKPFVIWILLATDAVEAHLAEAGFFDVVNCVDWAPCQIFIWGDHLRGLSPTEDVALEEGHPPRICSAAYKDIHQMTSEHPPDLVAVFMPELPCPGEPRVPKTVPDDLLVRLGKVPVVVTMRFDPPASSVKELRSQLEGRLLFGPQACPFSARTGGAFQDNGWLLALDDGDALCKFLNLEVQSPSPKAPVKDKDRPAAVFWGICDIKYDPTVPILERVQLLETGDGRTSKFSHDGAEIPRRFREQYRIKSGGGLHKYTVVSTDKKLTHDLMEEAGYGHIVPKQVCFPRRFEIGLGKKILSSLEIKPGDENDVVVLKLCNRSRGAGVLVVPADELDYTLADVLVPPHDMEAWLSDGLQRLEAGSAVDLGLESVSEEQWRHWWGNEGPSFVAERYCTSMPTIMKGQSFDGTMRVSFALRLKQGSASTLAGTAPESGASQLWYPPEDLEVEWLGGYWKLPKCPLGSSQLRDRSVSAARTSGTAPVRQAHLHEVYAALGDSMQHLFGGAEPSQEWLTQQYADQPELEGYLVARLGLSSLKDTGRLHQKMELAQGAAARASEGSMKQCIKSFLSRGLGVCEVKPKVHDACCQEWQAARKHFSQAVEFLPWNANALFWSGMAELEFENLPESESLMNRSLLLDPDFKGPYVNLGVAYLRQGKYDRAIDISRACLARYPQSPQCHYHIGVAAYQKAVRLTMLDEEQETNEEEVSDADCNYLLELARDELLSARESEEAQKRHPEKTSRTESPWLPEDEQMLAEATALSGCRSPMPCQVQLPRRVGWRFLNWRS